MQFAKSHRRLLSLTFVAFLVGCPAVALASGLRFTELGKADVTEPATFILFGTGLAAMAAAARRKKTELDSPAV